MDSLLLEIVQTVDDFDLTPSNAVKLGNTQQVSFAKN